MTDTIYACATGPVPSALAVIRISGPKAAQAITAFIPSGTLPEPRKAHYTTFIEPDTGVLLDTGIALWFPGPHSFSGEDSAEWQIHGSPANVRRCLEAIGTLPGFRMAEAGEFSRRALEKGKIGLLELEGLADLLAADTAAQAKHAALQMSGGISDIFMQYRARLIHSMAYIEAYIDFPEEDDIPQDVIDDAKKKTQAILKDIQALLSGADRGRRMREGVNAVLFGAPNAGKSTLLNALTASQTAIVSDIPGTTRDAIHTRLDIAGYPVNLIDTAGIRDAQDTIEQEGIRRAIQAVQSADIAIAVCDASEDMPEKVKELCTNNTYIICNKNDKISADRHTHYITGAEHIYVSAAHSPEESAQRIIHAIETRLTSMFSVYGAAVATRERHRMHLIEAAEALEMFDPHTQPPEISAEYLRIASTRIGAIAGFTHHEDVLDVLFSEFCIGK